MIGSKEIMYWRSYLVFVTMVTCICCENVWNTNDEIENDQVKLESQRLNGYHYRHSLQNDAETSQHNRRHLSDEPSNAESIRPFKANDRMYMRRTNHRRRKMGSNNNNKKHIFSRGQRHRHNKNGNSFVKTTNQFLFFLSLITQSKAITNHFNLREMSFCLSFQ